MNKEDMLDTFKPLSKLHFKNKSIITLRHNDKSWMNNEDKKQKQKT